MSERRPGEFVRWDEEDNCIKLKIDAYEGEVTLASVFVGDEGKFILSLYNKTYEYETLRKAKLAALDRIPFLTQKLKDALSWHGIKSPYERCVFCGVKIN